MRGELLRMLMARRRSSPPVETADIAFDVIATSEQLTYQFAAKPLQQFEVEWGDGTSSTVATGATTPSHTYASAGVYRLRIVHADRLFDSSNYIKPGANNVTANSAYAAMVGEVHSWRNAGDYIWGYAFDKCTNMTGLDLPVGTDTVSDYAFRDCSSWAPAELPSSISKINGGAFLRCSSLALESLPGSLESMGVSCFASCLALNLAKLPDGLVSIGNTCFSNSKVDFREIPANVTTIGSRIFNNCWTQQSGAAVAIRFNGTPTSINEDAFTYSYIGHLYVPWAEGEVNGAPWGATNATIHYNSQEVS